MTEQGIAVERHLGVENAQMAVLHDDQRIDLQQRHVLFDERLVERREQGLGIVRGGTRELESLRDCSDVGIRDAGFRLDGDRVDLLRRVVGDRLDVHAAFGRNDEGHLTDRPVDQERAVELAVDVCAVFDVQTVDLLAGIAGLRRYQRVAEHVAGVGHHFLDGLGKAHAALGIGTEFLELALAATAGMNLALDHIERTRQRLRSRLGLLDLEDGHTFGNRSAEALEQSLGLIFVNIHQRFLGCSWRDYFSAGAMLMQASQRPATAPTDFWKASSSLLLNSTSMMRSTPPAPMTVGTPTYMSFTPYWPER